MGPHRLLTAGRRLSWEAARKPQQQPNFTFAIKLRFGDSDVARWWHRSVTASFPSREHLKKALHGWDATEKNLGNRGRAAAPSSSQGPWQTTLEGQEGLLHADHVSLPGQQSTAFCPESMVLQWGKESWGDVPSPYTAGGFLEGLHSVLISQITQRFVGLNH